MLGRIRTASKQIPDRGSTAHFAACYHCCCLVSLALLQLACALTAPACAQLAFVGHDVGHNRIFHRRSLDSLVGLFISFFLGASVQWWKCVPTNRHPLLLLCSCALVWREVLSLHGAQVQPQRPPLHAKQQRP